MLITIFVFNSLRVAFDFKLRTDVDELALFYDQTIILAEGNRRQTSLACKLPRFIPRLPLSTEYVYRKPQFSNLRAEPVEP